MDPQALVDQLGTDGHLGAMRALVGGVTATELRSAQVTEASFRALVGGLQHDHPRVRWWCVQLLDHIDDPRALTAVAVALDDDVPRVRRNAAHALGCLACKPGWDGTLEATTIEKLTQLAQHDPNAKVRAEAAAALQCAIART